MKKIFLAIALIVFNISIYAQDIIIKKNGEEIKAKIEEIGVTEIKYKKFENLAGPSYTIPKSNVLMIRHENGTNDIFNEVSTSPSSSNANTPNQDTTKNKIAFKQTYKWAVGVGAGFTTGYGVSIKYQPRKDGIQLNFFPYIDNSTSQQLICAGLEYNHELWDGRYNNVYFYIASSYTYYKNNEEAYNNSTGYYNYSHIKRTINSGCGIGVETNTQKRFVVDVMTGFAQYDSFKQIALTGEIALHFKFSKNN